MVSVIVIMGVSGCGKTTVASHLAQRLGWKFAEADLFHSPHNMEKMRSGQPLTDEDRWPWLEAIAAWIDRQRAAGEPGVVACSALKRSYRDIIVGDRKDVALVYLKGSYELIARRLAARQHEYMPASLLASQFATLEEPAEEENAIVISIEKNPEEIVEEILRRIR